MNIDLNLKKLMILMPTQPSFLYSHEDIPSLSAATP